AIPMPTHGPMLTTLAAMMYGADHETTTARVKDAIQRGLVVRGGDNTVKNLVAEGACDVGVTSSEAYFAAVSDHQPVAMLPFRVGTSMDGPTVVIPSTAAIVKEARHRKWA